MVEKARFMVGGFINPHAPLSQVLVKTDPSGSQTYYIYGLGLIAQEENGVYRTYHYDLRGSTVALTDENGTVTDRFWYGPYGELVHRTGTTETPFLYNGRGGVMTDANGLYYMRARYYSPETRRFVSRDRLTGDIKDPASLNRYNYVQNNPVTGIDPLGLWTFGIGGGVIGGLEGGGTAQVLYVFDDNGNEGWIVTVGGGAFGGKGVSGGVVVQITNADSIYESEGFGIFERYWRWS